MTIDNGYFVACSYDLYSAANEGQEDLIEKAPQEAPLKFIAGSGMMLDKFEENLKGLNEGDTFDFILKPEEAYGNVREDLILKLNKEIFTTPEGKFDTDVVKEGNMVPMQTNDGQIINGYVNEITDEFVEMDFNHQLAGIALHFKGKILEVRPATPEDEAYFSSLHNHGGCGCGCDCSSSDDCSSGSCGSGCGCY